MKIYTKKGDKGTTGLFGGKRVDKDDVRVECYGTLDEVNSTIGLLRTKLGTGHEWQPKLHKIQKDMMDMRSFPLISTVSLICSLPWPVQRWTKQVWLRRNGNYSCTSEKRKTKEFANSI
jgi:hypothetical protein